MDLELIRYFVKVVQHGSFSKAAEGLKLPKSTLSKAISRLEKEAGTKLLLRTTRSLTLTASGRTFYENSLGPVQSLEEAQKSLYGQDSLLAGTIKMTAPEDLGSTVIANVVAELSQRHSALHFELNCTNTVLDLVRDGYDLAVRIGKLNESNFKSKRVGHSTMILVASPPYLKDKSKIRHPKDLKNLEGLSYTNSAFSAHWVLKSKRESVQIPMRSKIFSNQMTTLIQMAVKSAGVAFAPQFLCRPLIEQGDLVHLLPDWHGPEFPVSIVTPLSFTSSARLKITVDTLAKALQKALA